MTSDNLILLFDARHGQYIPKLFIEECLHNNWNLENVDIETLKNPENEWYWHEWEQVLNNAYYVDNNGVRWSLHQDGDLWAIAYDLMTKEDYLEFFGEYYED